MSTPEVITAPPAETATPEAKVKKTLYRTGLFLILANAIQFIKAFNETFEELTKFFGAFKIDVLQGTIMLAIFAALFVILLTLLKHKERLKRQKKALLAGAILALVSIANIAFTELRVPEPRLEEKIQQWAGELDTNRINNAFIVGKGVPVTQVWTDAQILKGLLLNARREPNLIDREDIRKTFDWIEKERRQHVFGWPYFSDCKPDEPSVTEISGWVVVALAESLRVPNLWEEREAEIRARISREIRELMVRQQTNGGFSPIRAKGGEFTRTYSTLMAVWAINEAQHVVPELSQNPTVMASLSEGIEYLCKTYNTNLYSWVPKPDRPRQNEPFVGLTGQVLYVLSECDPARFSQPAHERFIYAAEKFIDDPRLSQLVPGENKRMHDADQHLHSTEFATCFQLEGSTYLGYPWVVASLNRLHHAKGLSAKHQARTLKRRAEFLSPEMVTKAIVFMEGDLFYVWAEYMIAFGTTVLERDTTSFQILQAHFGYKFSILLLGISLGIWVTSVGSKKKK